MKPISNEKIQENIDNLTSLVSTTFKTLDTRLKVCEKVTEANPEALNGEQRISVLEQTILLTNQVQNEMIQLLNQTATSVFGTQTEEQETPGKSKEEEPIVEEAVVTEVTEEPLLAVDEEYPDDDEEDDDEEEFELPPGALPVKKKH